MKGSPEHSPLFHQIQPVCISIIDAPTLKNVQHLHSLLQNHLAEKTSLQPLQEYILFPADTVLRLSVRDERLTIAALQVMTVLLEHTHTSRAGIVVDLLPRVFLLLGHGVSKSKVPPASLTPPTSEELRLAAVRCGTALVLSCVEAALDALYAERGRLALGHAVFQLTATLRSERSRPLRLAALDCLLACSGAERPLPAAVRHRAGRVCVALLPGVLSALHAVFAGDLKQGHRVIARAVHVWAALVRHVLGDAALAADSDAQARDEPAGDRQLPSLARTEAWLRDTAERLVPMVGSLTPLTRHHQPDVRLGVLRLAEGLLTDCARSLAVCASPLTQLLVLVTCDVAAEVRSAAEAAVTRVQAGMSKTLLEAVEEDFYLLTSRLPGVIRSHDVQNSLVQLSLLEGYLHLLGPRVRQLTASAAHVRRLLSCLCQLVELRTDSAVVPCVTTFSPSGTPNRMPDFKRFRHFDDDEVWRRICSACRLLGCHGDLLTLLELLDTDSAEDRVIWNQLLLGQEPALLAARRVSPQPDLEEQLDLEPLILLVEPSQRPLRRCLGLEALTHVARVTGGRHAALHVLALCPALEAAGTSDPLVAEAARAALAAMAGDRGVPALLAANVRRLAVHVRTRLADRRGRQAAPLLVAAVLRFSGPETLPHLEDTVRAVMRALDDDYEQCGESCLATLRSTVEAVLRWYPPSAATPPESSPPPTHDRLLAHHRRQASLRAELARAAAADAIPVDAAEGFRRHWEERAAAEGTDRATSEHTEAEETKRETPLHVRLVRDVVQQSVHFLDCDTITVQVDVLATLSAGSRLLAEWPDELLPLAARCWQPLLRCCRATDPLLLRHALATLHALVAGAGDFLRRRVTSGPLQPLLQWLASQAAVSAAQRPAANYAHTQARKLQLTSLQSLGDVAVRLQLGPLQLVQLVRAVQPYLSCRQPVELQQAARQLLLTVAEAEGDTVWLCLRHLLDTAEERTQHDNARQVLCAIDATADGTPSEGLSGTRA